MDNITDFETELRVLCERYEKLLPHAALVGTLEVVKHIYLDAQITEKGLLVPEAIIEDKPHSPLPKETINAGT